MDAILLDLTLPGMSGWQTLRLAEGQSGKRRPIPVVVLSVLEKTDEKSLAAHADGWVSKAEQGQSPGEQNLMRELARVIRKEDERICVLLVEDDEDLARIIMATFEQAGVEIFHAATRLRAIEMCQSVSPGIMILDLSLPDGDGFGVVDWLRQRDDLHTAAAGGVFRARRERDGTAAVAIGSDGI